MTTHRRPKATDAPRAGEPRAGELRARELRAGERRAVELRPHERPSPLATILESAAAIVSIAVVGLLSAAISAAPL